jgi:hypothetical protein
MLGSNASCHISFEQVCLQAGETCEQEARADHYLDLCTLAMLRASHVAESGLQARLSLARCKMGSYHGLAIKAASSAAKRAKDCADL